MLSPKPTPLALTYGPAAIFSQIAEPVTRFDAALAQLTQNMVATLYQEHAVGLGANMVGILQRIVVIDLQEKGIKNPQVLINPEITAKSDETQKFEEASVCFPGISAKISRPQKIKIRYQDTAGNHQNLTAEGYLATVLQHEIDYLNGVIFLDYLSPLKRKILIKKTLKHAARLQKEAFKKDPHQ